MSRLTVDNLVAVRIREIIPDRESKNAGDENSGFRSQD